MPPTDPTIITGPTLLQGPRAKSHHIITTVVVDRSIDDVFGFLATPATWPRWHADSLGVTGVAGRPAQVGEQFVETFLLVRGWSSVTWTITEVVWPQRLVIEAQAEQLLGSIAYALSPWQAGTRVERVVTYRLASRLGAGLDWLFVRGRLQSASAQALRRLKLVLEDLPATSPGASRASGLTTTPPRAASEPA